MKAIVFIALSSLAGITTGFLLAVGQEVFFLDVDHKMAHRVFARVLFDGLKLVCGACFGCAGFLTWRRLDASNRQRALDWSLHITAGIVIGYLGVLLYLLQR